jgi:transketolase
VQSLCRQDRHHNIIRIYTFGSSASIKDLFKKFGFMPEKIQAAAKEQIAKTKRQTA